LFFKQGKQAKNKGAGDDQDKNKQQISLIAVQGKGLSKKRKGLKVGKTFYKEKIDPHTQANKNNQKTGQGCYLGCFPGSKEPFYFLQLAT
jgi:hypothetical protein